MRGADTRAVPVGSRPLGGADVLVTLITPRLGRIRAVARGARLPLSHFGSALEPFGMARLILAPGRETQGWLRIEEAEAVARLDRIRGSLARLSQAGRVCAWARALAGGERGPQLYALLWRTLVRLDREACGEGGMADFLWRLAGLSGVAPELSHCVICHGMGDMVALRFHPGGAVCATCRGAGDMPLRDGDVEALRGIFGTVTPGPLEGRRLVALGQRYLRAHFGEELP